MGSQFLTIGAGESVEIDHDQAVAAVRLLAKSHDDAAREFGHDLAHALLEGEIDYCDAARWTRPSAAPASTRPSV